MRVRYAKPLKKKDRGDKDLTKFDAFGQLVPMYTLYALGMALTQAEMFESKPLEVRGGKGGLERSDDQEAVSYCAILHNLILTPFHSAVRKFALDRVQHGAELSGLLFGPMGRVSHRHPQD